MDKPLAATDHHAVDAQPFDDDLQLARRIADGDARAFELLMRRHNRMLFRLARSILADDAECEEALQEAYIAVYRWKGNSFGILKSLLTEDSQLVRFDAISALFMEGGPAGRKVALAHAPREPNATLKKLIADPNSAGDRK